MENDKPILENVTYRLPNTDSIFAGDFLAYLSPLGNIGDQSINFRLSDTSYFPKSSIEFSDTAVPRAIFSFSDGTSCAIDIVNNTGMSKTSPHTYSPVTLKEFIARSAPYPPRLIDHTGFNIPFFNGIHPEILELREKLKQKCLYHTFPKHLEDAPWDFILPGTKEEISGKMSIDYSPKRTPKIEIVSFEKCSTPLIQIDLQVEGGYSKWNKLFPEAINDSASKNSWVYIQNDFGIDICFVLNEFTASDWSHHFSKSRLL